MDSRFARYVSLEEQELSQRRKELALLEEELADRELFLANLRAELPAFKGRYLREVGGLYAELDEWNAKIAELAAEASGTDEARQIAADARGQAAESYAAAHGNAANAAEFSPSAELKQLYKDVVRPLHPDRATSEADRALHERLVADANLAYQHQDVDALRRSLGQYKIGPESVKREGVVADLERVLRQIRLITRRVEEIRNETEDLASSNFAILMSKVHDAATRGRDLLAEMRASLRQRIHLARETYETQASRQRAR